jgi:DNA-binding MarR family transcriptional regulator
MPKQLTTSPGPQRQISLLFDVFVLNQRLRALLSQALAGTGMRPDEYAVYSLLYEVGPLTPTEMATQMGMPLTTVLDYRAAMIDRKHVRRRRHPRDGRSYQLSLTKSGLAAFWRASAAWNRDVQVLERTLGTRQAGIRRALHALDDAAAAAILHGSAIREDPTG